jgi:hypothetical protein
MTKTYQRRGLRGRCELCGGKLLFHSRGDAQRFAKRTKLQGDPWVVPYPCPHGPGWHLGHSLTGEPFVPVPKETAHDDGPRGGDHGEN